MSPELRKVKTQTEPSTPGESLPVSQPVAERKTVPLTLEMVTTHKVKPGDYLVATQDVVAQEGSKIFTAGTFYKVRGYVGPQEYQGKCPGGLRIDSDYKRAEKPWVIDFGEGGLAETFQVVQYTGEEKQFQNITDKYGELPVRILDTVSRYPSGVSFQDMQQGLVQELHSRQDISKLMPEINKAFIELRNSGYVAVAPNKRVAITPLGKRYLETT